MIKKEEKLNSLQEEFNKIQEGDTTTYATKLKGYGYYGADVNEYINGLNWALKRMKVVDFYFKNESAINYSLVGGLLIGITAYVYYIMKKFRKI